MGLASVAVPLLALEAGYSAVGVGLLAATSAVAQMATRLVLGPAMRLFADWTLVAAACLTLAASNALIAVSAALVPFVVAEVLQGFARACFWTGSQTHVVRREGPAVSALATMNFVSSIGLLAGPVLAGVLSARSPSLALAVGAGVAALATIPALLLDRLPPFSPPADRPAQRLWRRPGVDVGCWAGMTAGAWRGLIGSYVPVALVEARQSATTVGLLVATANAASVAGAWLSGRLRGRRLAQGLTAGVLMAGLATALTGWVAGSPWLAGAALAVSGVGAGAIQVVGPAVAAEAVHREERGEAIAVTGTFRAAALFLSPLAVAGMVTFIPLGLALAVAGSLIAVPALGARRTGRPASAAGGPTL